MSHKNIGPLPAGVGSIVIGHLHHDFETASECDLKVHGILRYAKHPSTHVLMLSWRLDNGEIVQWVPQSQRGKAAREELARKHPDFYRMLTDSSVRKMAHNFRFERLIFKYVLGIDIPLDQWEDTMIMAYQRSLPGDLATLGEVINVEEAKKDKRGERLIQIFCKPRPKNQVTSAKPWIFNNAKTHPQEWEEFLSYNKQDVRAESKVYLLLKAYPVPEIERDVWLLDEEVNERGMPIDLEFVNAAWRMVQTQRKKKLALIGELTGVDNPNSRDQVLNWLKINTEYPFDDMTKESVGAAIRDFDLGEIGNKVLYLWKYAAKTSVNKYKQMLDIQVDGRLCFCFQYGGAQRTLRWAGRKPQLQNLPSRFPKVWSKNIDEIRQLILDGMDEWIEIMYGEPIEALVACVRTAIAAPEGEIICCADLGSIESRGIGHVSKCQAIIKVFDDGRDMYKVFAARLFGVPYEEVTKEMRDFCKPPVLGSGFGLGAGGVEGVYPHETYFGLRGYAKNMGVDLSQQEAQEATDLFRSMYAEVPNCWYALEEAALKALVTKTRTRVVAKHPVTGEYNGYPLDIWFDVKPPFLRMELPSGRHLYYLRPQRHKQTLISKRTGRSYEKWSISYEGYDEKKRWTRIRTYGGKFIENLVQAWARDVLAVWMLRAAKKGFKLLGYVHDELIALVPKEKAKRAVELLVKLASIPPDWHDGIALSAEGFCAPTYRKG